MDLNICIDGKFHRWLPFGVCRDDSQISWCELCGCISVSKKSNVLTRAIYPPSVMSKTFYKDSSYSKYIEDTGTESDNVNTNENPINMMDL